jgi:hypothetical protein
LIDEWEKYLRDPAQTDYTIFAPVLTDTVNPVTPEQVLGTLPGGMGMAARVNDLVERTKFNGLYHLPDPARALKPDQLTHLAKEQAREIATYLEGEKQRDLASHLIDPEVILTSDIDDFHATINNNRALLNEGISFAIDDFITSKTSKDLRLLGAGEAILHLTMMPLVTNYILDASVGFPVSFKPGFELYIGGGRCSYFDDRILLLVPKD